MASLKRITVNITTRQNQVLRTHAENLGLTFSEMLRRAIFAWEISIHDTKETKDNETSKQ